MMVTMVMTISDNDDDDDYDDDDDIGYRQLVKEGPCARFMYSNEP